MIILFVLLMYSLYCYIKYIKEKHKIFLFCRLYLLLMMETVTNFSVLCALLIVKRQISGSFLRVHGLDVLGLQFQNAVVLMKGLLAGMNFSYLKFLGRYLTM